MYDYDRRSFCTTFLVSSLLIGGLNARDPQHEQVNGLREGERMARHTFSSPSSCCSRPLLLQSLHSLTASQLQSRSHTRCERVSAAASSPPQSPGLRVLTCPPAPAGLQQLCCCWLLLFCCPRRRGKLGRCPPVHLIHSPPPVISFHSFTSEYECLSSLLFPSQKRHSHLGITCHSA